MPRTASLVAAVVLAQASAANGDDARLLQSSGAAEAGAAFSTLLILLLVLGCLLWVVPCFLACCNIQSFEKRESALPLHMRTMDDGMKMAFIGAACCFGVCGWGFMYCILQSRIDQNIMMANASGQGMPMGVGGGVNVQPGTPQNNGVVMQGATSGQQAAGLQAYVITMPQSDPDPVEATPVAAALEGKKDLQ